MSYYKTIDGKKMDGAIIDAADEAVKGDGRISKADAEKILKFSKDGGKITDIERTTLEHVFQKYKWTEAAEGWFNGEISKL